MNEKAFNIAAAVMLMLITAAVFFGLYDAKFLSLDDVLYVVNNPLIKDFSPSGIWNIFTSVHFGLYKPVVLLSFALDYYLFGFTAGAYHLVNVFFHILNTLLVFWLIFKISKKTEVSFLTALLFALHPMHVESVAWVSERKDMLYSFFLLLSANFYLLFNEKTKYKFYVFSLICFILSMLCKPAGVLFFFVLFLLDFITEKQFSMRGFKLKMPFIIIAGLVALLNLANLNEQLFYKPENYGIVQYISVGFYSFLIYLKHLFVFNSLTVIYPFPAFDSLWLKLAPFFTLALSAGVLYFGRKNKTVLFGFLFFAVMLFPALPFKPTSLNVAFDHYSYLPYVGMFYIVSCGLYYFITETLKNNKLMQGVLILLLSGSFIWMAKITLMRVGDWHDGVTLWTAQINKYPRDEMGYTNRATAYMNINENSLAKLDFFKAISLNPGEWGAYSNLGSLYYREGNFAAAEDYYKKALALDNKLEGVYVMLAQIYLDQNKSLLAGEMAAKALEINPASSSVYAVKGMLAEKEGDNDLSEAMFLKAAASDPGNYYAYYELAGVYLRKNEREKACVNYFNSLKQNPSYGPAARAFEEHCL